MKTPATILIVDDNVTNLGVLYDYLVAEGFRVLTAESGESALKRVEHVRPDAILLDVMMPGIDGFETCRLLRLRNELKDTPIVFMTALDDTGSKVSGFEAGAVDYITKPIRQEEALVRLRTHLRLSELRSELEAQVSQRDEAIAELDAFAHTVAHDLKNPAAGIANIAAVLRDDFDSLSEAERGEMLDLMEHGSRDLLNIIDALLTLASVRKESVKPVPVEMDECVHLAMERLQPMIRAASAQVSISPAMPQAMGHPAWLAEVWMNLISNSIKYGGKPPVIEVTGEPLNGAGQVRFSVKDRGRGVPPESRSQLFQPFAKMAEIRTEGSGLGLSIVCRILNRLGSQPMYESREGGGSIFYFDLPAVS